MRMDDARARLLLLAACAALGAAAAAGFIPFLSSELVWDDSFFHADFQGHPWRTALGPFNFSASFWRPLATSSVALGWSLARWLGDPGSILAAKALGLPVFAAAVAMACASCAARLPMRAGSRARPAAAALLLGALLGCAPAMAEPVLWLSDRGDLLLCAELAAALWLAHAGPEAPGFKWGAFAIGLCMGFSKEAGILWCLLLCLATLRDGRLAGWSAAFGAAAAANLALWRLAAWGFHAGGSVAGMPLRAIAAAAPAPRPPAELALSFLESLGRAAYIAAAPWLEACAIHPEGGGSLACKACGAAVLALSSWAAARLARPSPDAESSLARAFAAAAAGALLILSLYSVFSALPGESASFSIQKDRYVAPSLLVLASLAARRAASRPGHGAKACLAGLACAALLSAPAAISSRGHWRSGLDLWGPCAALPDAPMIASINGARALMAAGRDAEALALSQRAIQLHPLMEACALWGIVEAAPQADSKAVALASQARLSFPDCPPIAGPPGDGR